LSTTAAEVVASLAATVSIVAWTGVAVVGGVVAGGVVGAYCARNSSARAL